MSSVIPKISCLSKSVIRVLGCNPSPMTLQGTNTYIIGTGRRRMLLDTGEQDNQEYLMNLGQVLKENGCEFGTIIISHWHHDHIGGLEDVIKINPALQFSVMKFPRSDQLETHSAPTTRIQWLKDGDEIKVEGATIRVHHTPGHTSDHVILQLCEEGIVFSGDCILGEGTAVFEDLYHYMQSLQTILDLDPKIIYPGHGPVISDPTSKIRFYVSHRNEREAQILDALRKCSHSDATPISLVKLIYTETPPHLHPAAANNVRHHLKKLEKEGRVECVDEELDLWRPCTTTAHL